MGVDICLFDSRVGRFELSSEEENWLVIKLCFAAQFVQEWNVWDETIIVFWGSQFGKHLGSILVLVVQLAQLNVVMVVARVVGFSGGQLHFFNDFTEFGEFLASIISLTMLDASLLGDIHTNGIENIHEVVHVKFAFAIPIVDVADFKGFSFVNRHVDFWLFLDFSSEDSSKRPTLESNKQISTPMY